MGKTFCAIFASDSIDCHNASKSGAVLDIIYTIYMDS